MRWLAKEERKFMNLFGGILFLIVALGKGYATYEEFLVQRHGEVVTMQLVDKSTNCRANKGRPNAIFSHNSERYKKEITPAFCEQSSVGQLIEMKYLPGTKVVMFPAEQTFPTFCLIVGGIFISLFFIGSYFIGMSTPWD